MKKNILILTFAIIGLIAMNASAQTQPPNAGFENWVPVGPFENPTGWSSFNNFYSYGVPEMSFKTTDANAGTYALRLISDTATVPPPFGTNTLDTLAGFVFLGSADMSNPGMPYTERPLLMQAFVKGTIMPGGNAILMATLRKWNTSSHTRDQVGTAMYFMTSSVSSYTQISVPFNYSLPDNPDTLEIKIMAGDVGPGGVIMPGNEFFIDDISLTFPVGVNDANTATPAIVIFPDPATDYITIGTQQISEIKISTMQGQVMKIISTGDNNTSIDISAFPRGMYVAEIKTEQGVYVKKFVKE